MFASLFHWQVPSLRLQQGKAMAEVLSARDVASAAKWFAAAFAYPEDDASLVDNSHYAERWLEAPGAFLDARDRVEYTGLFDIGNPEPPAPLMESHYQQDAQAKLRQVVTFYRTYGVINETEFSPDHLCVELSFLGFLASLACDYPDREDLTRAYRFFAKVHLGSWLHSVIDVLENKAPHSPWTALLKAANQFINEVAQGLDMTLETELSI